MADNKAQIGRAMRFVASGGWTTEDPDVMAELLERAEALALSVAADPLASSDVRELAQDFLDRVKLDLA
ncbi:MAG TPA: hypothetical protein VND88_03845 [Candidatus Acidoferrales bacterium]|nr:hypothetical protein [Candidatus Acidoferrales bacterium]